MIGAAGFMAAPSSRLKIGRPMKQIEADVLQAIKKIGHLATVAEVCEESGWSRSGVSVALRELRDAQIIDRVGGGSKGCRPLWGLPRWAAEARAEHAGSYLRLDMDQRRAAVLRTLAEGPGSAEDIGRRIGWPGRPGVLVVRGILADLVHEMRAAVTLGRPWIWRLA